MRKSFETQRARGALLGIALRSDKDQRGQTVYRASCWKFSCTFESLAHVEAWLDMLGGKCGGNQCAPSNTVARGAVWRRPASV